jgi:hypothetical protein
VCLTTRARAKTRSLAGLGVASAVDTLTMNTSDRGSHHRIFARDPNRSSLLTQADVPHPERESVAFLGRSAKGSLCAIR